MRRLAVVGIACMTLFGASGCAPTNDAAERVGAGCNRQVGAGPRNVGVDPPGIPLIGIAGLTPVEAAAAARGHVVVFRLDHLTCVCVPPAGYGPVDEGFWGSNGVLYLDLENVQPQGDKPPDGTGC